MKYENRSRREVLGLLALAGVAWGAKTSPFPRTAIIRTILNLARTLGLDVIAEGTETAAQVGYLEGLDCKFGQGYFFSRPVPLDDVPAILQHEQDMDRHGLHV